MMPVPSPATAFLHGAAAAALAGVLVLAAVPGQARPITTKEGVLPPGTELNEEPLDQPNELFLSELATGKRSYLLNLGDMLFSSPAILGGPARQAGMSCETCHQQGSNNAKLFVPGLSSRPGTFDTTGPLFNPSADNGVFDPVRVPSLRGAKQLAPYAHDGRFAALPEFIRHVIVDEFAGPEPSQQVVDALEHYISDIAFLPNPKVGPAGVLSAAASDAARRGEILFNKPFPHEAAISCATCHQPGNAFTDHAIHDVGSGGRFKTPTLLNANFNAPYFHDGRFDSYGQVVDFFDRKFELALSDGERADLIAYLDAVGDAKEPIIRSTVQAELDEIASFVSVLETALPAHNKEIIALTVDAVGNAWREMGENFPPAKDPSVTGGLAERKRARGAVKDMVLTLRRIAMASAVDDFARAAQAFAEYKAQAGPAATSLKVAEAWSLFNPQVREAHFAALRQLADLANKEGQESAR